jgi:hypothetical protein
LEERKEMITKTKGIKALVTVFTVFLLSSTVLAVDCPIPDTGQTKCYDDDSEISCPQQGEDFYGQDAHYSCNPQSYTKLGYGGIELDDSVSSWLMVRDNVTGLIWENKTDDSSIHDENNSYNWQDAQDVFIAALNNDNFGGYSDWRLPTVKELSFIRNMNYYYPAINTTFFPNTEWNYYWSSTTSAGDPYGAWLVDFDIGFVFNYDKSNYDLYVRAVRGGQCGSLGNFINNGDGTVTDTDTGLMWQQATAPDTYTWQQALSYCENLTLAGYDDWRLPNINELQSLVDYERYDPSINTTYFTNTVMSDYWSSTTYAEDPDHVWTVIFGWGSGSLPWKSPSFHNYVRAVRAGQCGSLSTTTTTPVPSSTTTTISVNTTTTTTIDAGELYIFGNVVDTDNGGVQGIPVILKFNSKEGGSEQDTSLTDANGGFIFPDLDENTYYVYPESVHAYSPEKEEVELKNEPVYVKFIQLEESSSCPVTEIYGADSNETNLLRAFRDKVLKNDPAGRELINLYYAYSPLVVEMMKNDEFKEEVKENIDLMLRLLVTIDYHK